MGRMCISNNNVKNVWKQRNSELSLPYNKKKNVQHKEEMWNIIYVS